MTQDEKKDFLSGKDVPDGQMTNPWSIKVDDSIDKNKYIEEHKAEDVSGAKELVKLGRADFSQNVSNLLYIIQDVLAGDQSAMQRPEFKNMNFPAIKTFIEWFVKTDQLSSSGKVDLMKNAWRLNFKCKPPTPEEFITDKYIGAQAEALYKPVKDAFCEFLDPLKPYRTVVLYPSISWGKSTLAVLVQLYISVHYAMMWHPYAFFGLAPSSIFTQCLGGWNQKKASELLLEPFTNILETSPYFIKVRTHSDLVEASAEEIQDCIHWTTSAPTAQPLDSKIIMADGSKKDMGNIQIGDKVKSPSEGITEVVNIPYHGIADCYEIVLEDGRTVRCSDQHLWKARKSPKDAWEVLSLRCILDHPEFEWEIADEEDCEKFS